jgi:hypothetical protein
MGVGEGGRERKIVESEKTLEETGRQTSKQTPQHNYCRDRHYQIKKSINQCVAQSLQQFFTALNQ